jgi:hypothetical protein
MRVVLHGKKRKKNAYERKKVKKKREKNYLHSKRAHVRVVLHEKGEKNRVRKEKSKKKKTTCTANARMCGSCCMSISCNLNQKKKEREIREERGERIKKKRHVCSPPSKANSAQRLALHVIKKRKKKREKKETPPNGWPCMLLKKGKKRERKKRHKCVA